MENSLEVSIRLIQEGELEPLLGLYRDLAPDDLPIELENARRIFGSILASREVEVWVAVHGGLIVASCVSITVPNLTRGGRSFVVIENVVTKSEYRRRGIGRRLLKHVIDLSHQRGAYKVMLQSGSNKESTKSFYKGLGFRDNEKTAFVIRDNVPKVRY